MRYAGSVIGAGAALLDRFLIASNVSAGQIVCMGQADSITVSAVGAEICNPASKIIAADVFGITEEAGTKSTTKGTAGVDVLVCYNPLAIYDAVITGGTGDDENQALTIAEQDTADANALILDDAGLATDCMVGGLIYALTGANAGQRRILNSYTSEDSCGWAGNPFNVTIASGDQFLIFGPSRVNSAAAVNIALSTSFTQVPQHQSCTDGVEAAVVDVLVDDYDVSAPTARVLFVVRDHIYNPS